MASMSAMVFAALLAIFVVIVLVRVLGRAALGILETEAVLPTLVFGVVNFLPVLLSLALFVGVFMSLGRIWRESEAVIWMMGGIGPLAWIRPVLIFATPMVLLIALVSFVGLPWSARTQAEYEAVLKTRDEVSSLSPGLFAEDAQGRRVHFVETISADGLHVGNVFVQSQLQGRTGVMVARQGHVDTHANGERYLVLEQGRRYEGVPGAADFRVGEFASHAVRIQPQAVAAASVRPRMLSVAELFATPTPTHMGEWVWRAGFPVSALLLALLALPMSYVNPRAGRSLNVMFAVLIYVAYNNFVGLSEGWVTHASMSANTALVLVHGSMLLVLLGFYWRRFRGVWSS